MTSDVRGIQAICFYRQQRPAAEVVDLIFDLHGGCFDAKAQCFLMKKCVRDEFCTKNGPGDAYIHRVLKSAIRKIEDQKGEVEEDVLDLYMELMGKHKGCVNGSDGCSHKTFTYGRLADGSVIGGGHVTLNVSSDMLAGSTGCKEWEAGFVLAELLLNNPALFQGKVSVELGSGTGLVGICLHKVGCSTSVLTDGSMEALRNCRVNLNLNGVPNGWHEEKEGLLLEHGLILPLQACHNIFSAAQGVHCVPLKWGEPTKWRPDVALGADVIYDPDVIPSLVSTLVSFLAPTLGGTETKLTSVSTSISWHDWLLEKRGDAAQFALVASTVRNPTTLELFISTAMQRGLVVQELVDFEPDGGISFQWLPFREKKSTIVIHCISVK